MAKEKQVYLFFGEDAFLRDKACTELVEKIKPSLDESFGFEQIDGAVNTVAEAVDAIGKTSEALVTRVFFGNGKLVWLKKANFLDRSVTGRSTTVKDKINEIITLITKGLPEGHILLVSAPAVDKATSFYKTCKKAGDTREFTPEKTAYRLNAAIKDFIAEEAKLHGLTIRSTTIAAFQEKVGSDKAIIHQEIEKLSVYLGDRKEITANDIKLLVSPSKDYSGLEFMDAMGERDLARATTLLKGMLFRKESPIGIISMMESRFKQFGIYKELDKLKLIKKPRYPKDTAAFKDMSAEQQQIIERLLKRPLKSIHSFFLTKTVMQTGNFTLKEINNIHNIIAQTHQKMVRSSVPNELLLELALIKICTKP